MRRCSPPGACPTRRRGPPRRRRCAGSPSTTSPTVRPCSPAVGSPGSGARSRREEAPSGARQNGPVPPRLLALLTAPSLDQKGAGQGRPVFRMADTSEPAVSALDLGVTRGDGVFETISIGAGRAQATEPHLGRLARSAAMLELPEPDLDAW